MKYVNLETFETMDEMIAHKRWCEANGHLWYGTTADSVGKPVSAWVSAELIEQFRTAAAVAKHEWNAKFNPIANLMK